MAQSTGVILAVGAISMTNELVFAPLAGKGNIKTDIKTAWRIPVATLVAAVCLGGLEKISPKLATGLAYTALISVLLARMGNAPAPVENLSKVLGFKA